MAYRYYNPDGATKSESDAGGSENEEDNSMLDDDEDDEFEDFDSDEENGKATFVDELNDPFEGMEMINPNRLRIWGMAASPGSGVVAVFATLYSTIKPERYTFAGLRCRVMFGKSLAPVDSAFFSTRKLSTEARAFEWMYGDAPPVPGVGLPNGTSAETTSKQQALREAFKHVAEKAKCALCDAKLEVRAGTSRCPKGHVFGELNNQRSSNHIKDAYKLTTIFPKQIVQRQVYPSWHQEYPTIAESAAPSVSSPMSFQTILATLPPLLRSRFQPRRAEDAAANS